MPAIFYCATASPFVLCLPGASCSAVRSSVLEPVCRRISAVIGRFLIENVFYRNSTSDLPAYKEKACYLHIARNTIQRFDANFKTLLPTLSNRVTRTGPRYAQRFDRK